VKTILNSGDAVSKVDIAIAGDGYKADQMGKWRDDADRLITALMKDSRQMRIEEGQEPYPQISQIPQK